jgi:hypothetical protein
MGANNQKIPTSLEINIKLALLKQKHKNLVFENIPKPEEKLFVDSFAEPKNEMWSMKKDPDV